ncbi:MAG: hypothetical protein PUN43_05205, partial [Candidatus Liberibacter asiaticus]|nr:hypothetical protein [Candidatus Liberibacter asiaticus]
NIGIKGTSVPIYSSFKRLENIKNTLRNFVCLLISILGLIVLNQIGNHRLGILKSMNPSLLGK